MQHDYSHTLNITQTQQVLGNFELTAETLAQACATGIESRDQEVPAWVETGADDALNTARQLDTWARQDQRQGTVHGIPTGAKDIFDVTGMPTRAGTSAFAITDGK